MRLSVPNHREVGAQQIFAVLACRREGRAHHSDGYLHVAYVLAIGSSERECKRLKAVNWLASLEVLPASLIEAVEPETSPLLNGGLHEWGAPDRGDSEVLAFGGQRIGRC